MYVPFNYQKDLVLLVYSRDDIWFIGHACLDAYLWLMEILQ